MERNNIAVPAIGPRAAGLAEDELAAIDSGDLDRHDKTAARAATASPEVDVIALGQFKLARAKDAVAAASGQTVITIPDGAMRKLQRLSMRKEAA